MPIGAGFPDFAQLKRHLRQSYAKKGKNLPDERLNAMTASVASNINPGWRSEAAKKAAMTRRARGER